MPHEQMNEHQVAAYLRMDVREVVKLASRGQIPCRKQGGAFVFRKGQVDHWVWERMHTLAPDRLAGIEEGVSAHHGLDADGMTVCSLIPPTGVAVPLVAKTRDATLRRLVERAEQADLVYDRDELLAELRQREELCSTALLPGVAVPHPRHPLPWDIAASFVVVGLTPGGIPYGAEDGSLTRLFFLICGKDERTHLHVLARLALMMHEPGAIDDLLACEDEAALRHVMQAREQAVLSKRT